MSVPTLDWTIMIYMAAPDESLQKPALTLLSDLQAQKIGSSEKVHVVIQQDTLALHGKRFFLNVAGQLPPLIQDDALPPDVNMGSVEAFLEFVKFVKKDHEAKHYLVVFDGHANGVRDFPGDESKPSAQSGAGVPALAETSTLPTPAIASHAIEASALAPTEAALEILNDPPDALTSRELKEALEQAKQILGKIDIIGFDACLMSMVEIAMQIRESATLMVGSEQAIPSKGWPYLQIIKTLVGKPNIEPRELAKTIVRQFVAFYEDQKEQLTAPVKQTLIDNPGLDPRKLAETIVDVLDGTGIQKDFTMLSVCDLAKVDTLSKLISDLVPQLNKCLTIPDLQLALLSARFKSLSFLDSDFVDLFNFCGHLSEALDDEPFRTACENNNAFCERLKTSCQAIMRQIGPAESAFVIDSSITFNAISPIKDAQGISIYLPTILPLYHELEFSQETRWHDFLKNYMTTFFLRADEISGSANAETFSSSANGNGFNTKGGTKKMSTHATAAPARTLCLVLDAGTTITDKATGKIVAVTGLSFLDTASKTKVHVPDGTIVSEPGKPSVRASSGTELRASSGTELRGTPGAAGGPPILEMVVPACTLRELTTTNPNTEFSDGTLIVATSQAPIVVVKKVTVTAPLP